MHEVVSKFDPKKRELVESTGFGGMLHFPPMRQINRKFGLCRLVIRNNSCW